MIYDAANTLSVTLYFDAIREFTTILRNNLERFICIWLLCAYLTPDPSPASNTGRKPQLFLAGEGVSVREGA